MTAELDNRLSEVERMLKVKLHDHQRNTLEALGTGKNVILHAPTGCHAPGQQILMFDGTIKHVENIGVGDMLMGPDSSPRTVQHLISGCGRMVTIRPVRGAEFVVNEDHILTLVKTGVARTPSTGSRKRVSLGGNLVDISVKEWEGWSKTQKHIHKLQRTGVEFSSREAAPIDPYMLGVLVGDGSLLSTPNVTTMDEEIESAVAEMAEQRGLYVRNRQQVGNKAATLYLSSGHRKQYGRAGGSNSLTNDLRGLGLWGRKSDDKFIPHCYKVGSRTDRLSLLAGLIDTDGYLHSNGPEVVTKSRLLADDTSFVARSLGFSAYVYETRKAAQTGAVGTYFRVSISGNVETIPCRLVRKQAHPRLQKKDPNRTGFSIAEAGDGVFYGFSLDGDGRYLLGDFTITHNSGKTVAFQGAPYVTPHKGITVILYPLRALVKDQTRRFAELGLPSVTLYGETRTSERPAIIDKILSGEAKFLLTTPESFDRNRRLQDALVTRGVAVLAVDEAHAYEEWADGFRPTYRNAGKIALRVGVKQFLLCSATLTSKGYRTARDTLGRSDWTIVQVPPIRSNLIYKDLSEPSSEILSRAVAGKGLSAPGICFFTTIKKLDEVANHVERLTGKKVLRYNGNLSAKARREAQEAFMSGNEWIFATKAFGMGIDKSNIRNIIHYQLPSSILSYAQECVHPNTPVRTPLGNRLAGQIIQGDEILGFDPKTGEPSSARVLAVYEGQTDRWINVRNSAGDELLVTPSHPFMVDGQEVRADHLAIGTSVTTLAMGSDRDQRTFTADCLDPDTTFAVVAPSVVDDLREKLNPAELGQAFNLRRPYDYTGYRRGKAAPLAALQIAADAAGLDRGRLYDNIYMFKTRSSKAVRLPVVLDGADLGWFAGIVATDGYVYRSDKSGFGSWKIKLTNTNQSIVDKFVLIAKSLGVHTHCYTRNNHVSKLSKKAAFYAEVSNPVLCDLLERLGIHAGRKSTTVECSDVVLGAPIAFRAGFAAGVVDGDGNLSPPRKSKPQGSVRFHTASWRFASSFSKLLKGLGIHVRLSTDDYLDNAHIMRCSVNFGYNGEIGRFESLRRFADVVAPHLVKQMFLVKAAHTDKRERIGSTITSSVIEISTIELDTPEPTLNWRIEPNHLMWTAETLTHNCGRAGRDGEESMCFLTKTERGDAAEFLLDMSVPSPELVHSVWKELQEIALDAADWFEVDWDAVCKRTNLWQQTVQACLSWLFTGKMIEKRQKRTTWKIKIHDQSSMMAAKYKHKAPEILEALRAEAQVEEGAAEFEMRNEELADVVGGVITGWREKLRKLHELGIFSVEEPPKGRSSYRFLHNNFKFAQGQDQLEKARKSAFQRLSAMRDLQRASASRRRELIEGAISLNMNEIGATGETEVASPVVTTPDDVTVIADDDMISY